MSDYKEVQKSIAAEFNAYKDRVRNIIDDAHWGEDGRHKEVVLMNYLKRILPKHLSVGTGFVKNKNAITKQIDIIIYENNYPTLFSEGDFVIAVPENVVGIIEVKSNISAKNLSDIVKTSNDNAYIICENTNKKLFNGIFSYASKNKNETIIKSLKNMDFEIILKKNEFQIKSHRLANCVNCICFDSELLLT